MQSKHFHNTSREAGEEISIKQLIFSLNDWWKYLVSWWVLILSFGFIGAVSGYWYSYIKKPVYTATTTFVLENGESSSRLGQYAGLASMMGIDLGGTGGGIFQGENIIELYKSRAMIEKTLLSHVLISGKSQLLIDRYISFNKLREAWKSDRGMQSLVFSPLNVYLADRNSQRNSRLKDSVLGSIVDDINARVLKVVKPDAKLNIIKVEVKSKDETFAKVFNDQIVKNVNDFYIQTKTKKSLENIAILKSKTDSIRAGMNNSIYTAAAIADATPNLNPTRLKQRTAPIQRSQFNAETNKEILGELIQNLEVSKMSLLKETPLIQLIDYPVYPLFKEKLGTKLGAIIGFFMFTFLIVFYLSAKRVLNNLLS